jgi:hypothetical protein
LVGWFGRRAAAPTSHYEDLNARRPRSAPTHPRRNKQVDERRANMPLTQQRRTDLYDIVDKTQP